jgi:succinate dehydrogenase / fumarate reductase flavoprotein subunit
MALDSKIPNGPISDKWTNYKNHINLVNPPNKRNLDVIVVGTEGWRFCFRNISRIRYNVKSFVSKIHRVARTLLRHKVELTQQNYQGDGDSVFRLFMRP